MTAGCARRSGSPGGDADQVLHAVERQLGHDQVGWVTTVSDSWASARQLGVAAVQGEHRGAPCRARPRPAPATVRRRGSSATTSTVSPRRAAPAGPGVTARCGGAPWRDPPADQRRRDLGDARTAATRRRGAPPGARAPRPAYRPAAARRAPGRAAQRPGELAGPLHPAGRREQVAQRRDPRARPWTPIVPHGAAVERIRPHDATRRCRCGTRPGPTLPGRLGPGRRRPRRHRAAGRASPTAGVVGQRVVVGSRGRGDARPRRRPPSSASASAGRRQRRRAPPQADVVVVAVPWDGHGELLGGAAPTSSPARSSSTASTRWASTSRARTPCRWRRARPPQQAAALLPGSTVVGGLPPRQRRAAQRPARSRVDTDVLVLGDDRAATDLVQALAGRIPGMRGVYAGRLRNAAPGGGADRQPHLGQPPLQGARRAAGHRRRGRRRDAVTGALVDDLGRSRRGGPGAGAPGRLAGPVADRVGRGHRARPARRRDRLVHPPGRPRRRPGRRHQEPATSTRSSRSRPDLVLANEEENRAADLAALRAAGLAVLGHRRRATLAQAFGSLGRMLTAPAARPQPGVAGRGARRPGPAPSDGGPPRAARRADLAPAVDGAGPRHVRRRRAGPARRRQRVRRRMPSATRRSTLGRAAAARPDLVVLPDEPYRSPPTTAGGVPRRAAARSSAAGT